MNRFARVVKYLSAPEADVKWGKASKSFTKAELEAGIHLVEAFPDNPFSEPFSQLDRAVGDKQSRETRAIKGVITNFHSLADDFPGDADVSAAIDTLRRKPTERSAQDAAQVRAAIKPVTHNLQITPK